MTGRKFLRRAALVCLAVALVLAAVSRLAGPALLRQALAEADRVSRASTGRPLNFSGPVSFSLLPLRLSFEGLRWGEDSSVFSLSARSGQAAVALFPLLNGELNIDELSLDAPVLQYRPRTPSAALSPSPAGNREKESAGAGREMPDASAMSFPLRLDRLLIREGRISVERPGGDRLTLSDITLSLRGEAGGSSGVLACDFAAALRKAGGELMKATLAAQGRVDLRLPDLSVSGLQLTLTPLTGLYSPEAGPVSLDFAGGISLETRRFALDRCVLRLPHARLSLTGTGDWGDALSLDLRAALEASPARMPLPALAGMESFTLEGPAALRDGALELPAFRASVNGSPLEGRLRLESAPLFVQGEIRCPSLDLTPLLSPAPSPDRQKSLSGPRDEGRNAGVSPDLDLTLWAGELTFRRLVLREAACTLAGQDGRYAVTALRALVDGQARLAASAELSLPERSWRSEGSVEDLDTSSLERAFDHPVALSALCDLRWKLSGSTAGGRESARALAGDGRLVLRNLIIPSLNRAIRENRNLSHMGLPASLDRVSLPFAVDDGRCRWTADLAARGLNGRGSGSLGLLDGELAGTADLQMQGLAVPLIFHGPVSSPACMVDGERLVRKNGSRLLGLPGRALQKAGRKIKGIFRQ